jgi:hypothetical protein
LASGVDTGPPAARHANERASTAPVPTTNATADSAPLTSPKKTLLSNTIVSRPASNSSNVSRLPVPGGVEQEAWNGHGRDVVARRQGNAASLVDRTALDRLVELNGERRLAREGELSADKPTVPQIRGGIEQLVIVGAAIGDYGPAVPVVGDGVKAARLPTFLLALFKNPS